MIGYPLSIRNLVDSLPGEGPAEERMSMIELLPPPLKRAFYTPERRRGVVTFRVQDLGIAQFDPVFNRITNGLKEIESRHPEFKTKLQGDAIWRWRNLYQIVIDLTASLGSASVIIFLTLTLAYRSLRIGLVSIIPNAFPLVVTGTWLVWRKESLELTSVCAFTVCLGIVVDDTIHFLSRFDEERRTAKNRHEAIRKAFGNVGVAMVMTTAVLVAGFGTVAFSDSRDHHIFASMGAITIAAALFGDLVMLPAMLACFAEKTDEEKLL
jgi:predicted RND superfamily exporter protein